jgi:RNA polymerase sigma-70 factor (ECF subfamily)
LEVAGKQMLRQEIVAGDLAAVNAVEDFSSAAFEAFYAATAPALARYIRRVCGHPAQVEDILQEAFYRFLRGRPQRMDEAQMRSYLYRAATTIIYDQWRRSKRAVAPPPPAAIQPDPSARMDVDRALGELGPRDRALLWLAYVEGANHGEIAAALGLSALSVRVLLFRARGRLARSLRRYGLSEEVTP